MSAGRGSLGTAMPGFCSAEARPRPTVIGHLIVVIPGPESGGPLDCRCLLQSSHYREDAFEARPQQKKAKSLGQKADRGIPSVGRCAMKKTLVTAASAATIAVILTVATSSVAEARWGWGGGWHGGGWGWHHGWGWGGAAFGAGRGWGWHHGWGWGGAAFGAGLGLALTAPYYGYDYGYPYYGYGYDPYPYPPAYYGGYYRPYYAPRYYARRYYFYR
jgi:hypothetical protein